MTDNFSNSQHVRKHVVATEAGVVASQHRRAADVGAAVPAHVLALATLAYSLGLPLEVLVEGIEGAYRDLAAGQREEAGGVSH